MADGPMRAEDHVVGVQGRADTDGHCFLALALMKRARDLAFEEQELNEGPIARRIAAAIGSQHHEVVLTEGRFVENLEAALLNEKIAPTLATAIRKEIISTFPWDDIVKKDDLLTSYVGYHRQLLAFFDQNWKTWKPDKPYFADQKIQADYDKLCQQITSTGKEIDTIYKRDNF